MGLDITAYKNISEIDCLFDADGEPVDKATGKPIKGEFFQPNVNHDFEGREVPVKDKAVYSYEDSFRFFAGSYSGYNQWREELAQLAGYPAKEAERFGKQCSRHDTGAWLKGEGPAFELISFSDCEGVIGSEVAKKLAADFDALQEQANAHPDEWFREKFDVWRKAFEWASQNGAVSFH